MNGGTLIFDTDIPAATLAEDISASIRWLSARVTTPGKAVLSGKRDGRRAYRRA